MVFSQYKDMESNESPWPDDFYNEVVFFREELGRCLVRYLNNGHEKVDMRVKQNIALFLKFRYRRFI